MEWLWDPLLVEQQGAVHSRCRAPTARGHLACAPGLCWDPAWPKREYKIKGCLGCKGNAKRRPSTIKA